MAITLTEYVNLRRLVTAGTNEIWWESNVATGEMTELAAANGDIDTTDQLNMFEAYQKAIIVNGANLKIADFGNTKITITALTDNRCPAKGDLLTQDQTGGKYAYMIVDFVNTARTNIYGYAYYAGGATAFVTTIDISSNDGIGSMDPNPIPHANISAVTAPPHWYDWITYPDVTIDSVITSYGSLPNKAYLGCLYNGRAVLSGNPAEPQFLYMSRQNNIWDWEYIANDDQTPVKGQQGDLGEIGDIVRCIASYKDEYLVVGCASSIFVYFGDPAHGGELRELTLTTGVFGANSYCWDNNNNFYFWGNNGLYKTTVPGVPVCISQFKLPRIVKDEAASPSTHRITLLYDNDRHGIVVAITVLATGANSNYWYDLNALDEQGIGGFFPESYATDCAIYSGIYYNSNTASLKGLVLGCTDGYIRTFDDTVKNDVPASGVEAIESYVGLGPITMSGVLQREGTLSGIDLTVAGGGIGGSQSDSDDVDFKVYTARTSEQVLERLYANTNPKFAGTFVGPGNVRGTTRRQTVRDSYLGLRLQNTTAGESWAFEDLFIHLKDSGRKK